MRVKDVMIFEVQFAQPDEQLREVDTRLRALGLPFLPVWDGCSVVGVLRKDAMLERAANAGLAAGSMRVRDIMDSEVPVCAPDDDAAAVADQLAREGKGMPGLVVLDSSHHLAGIVLQEDLAEGRGARRPVETGAYGAAQRKVDPDSDLVDHMSEESFPASDPPPPPSYLGTER